MNEEYKSFLIGRLLTISKEILLMVSLIVMKLSGLTLSLIEHIAIVGSSMLLNVNDRLPSLTFRKH